MRRILFFFAAFTLASSAHALDASVLDGGLDATLPDASLSDAATDAEVDAATDAEADAEADAAIDAGKKDSGTDASGACCPSLPCTCPAEAGNDDAGDVESDTSSGGGCSCDASGDAGLPSPFLLVALGVIARRLARKRK